MGGQISQGVAGVGSACPVFILTVECVLPHTGLLAAFMQGLYPLFWQSGGQEMMPRVLGVHEVSPGWLLQALAFLSVTQTGDTLRGHPQSPRRMIREGLKSYLS